MSRPELTGHASNFYNEKEARKYDSSSRMIGVQREITERAIELLRLPDNKPGFILDIGCGSGLSGKVLEEQGHVWVGCDVSRDMLNVANERIDRKREGVIRSARKKQANDDHEMEEEKMQEDSSDDEQEDDGFASTGDLMHHVRVKNMYRN
jgi:SAM-dependent methyltransferase